MQQGHSWSANRLKEPLELRQPTAEQKVSLDPPQGRGLVEICKLEKFESLCPCLHAFVLEKAEELGMTGRV